MRGQIEEEVCRIERKYKKCACLRPPYCMLVYDLINLVLEKSEEETS